MLSFDKTNIKVLTIKFNNFIIIFLYLSKKLINSIYNYEQQ